MRTSLKAALAGIAGAGLLLGGAGSLAYWDDEETVDGGTIKSGTLNVVDADCGDGWSDGVTDVVPLDSVYLIVPGTVLTKVCDFNLRVAGDVDATLAVNDQSVDSDTLGGELDVTTEWQLRDGSGPVSPAVVVNESNSWSFTELDNGKVLRATITVELPWDGDPSTGGDQVDNTSNSMVGEGTNAALEAVLEDLTVTVTQAP